MKKVNCLAALSASSASDQNMRTLIMVTPVCCSTLLQCTCTSIDDHINGSFQRMKMKKVNGLAALSASSASDQNIYENVNDNNMMYYVGDHINVSGSCDNFDDDEVYEYVHLVCLADIL